MNIWIDITHVPPLNFFKGLIKQLAYTNEHHVYITVLNRGKLPKIAFKELANIPNITIDVVGNHRMNKWSVLWDANIVRIIKLMKWAYKKNLAMSISGSVPCSLVSRVYNCKPYTLIDDPQAVTYSTIANLSYKSFCMLYKVPDTYKLHPKSIVLKSLKEWAYLAPSVFTPNISVLADYAITPHRYLFVREVSVGTSNYASQTADSILQIANYIPEDMPVLLSLEKKDKRDLYPNNWILLQEPLKDIHSLIYYSCGLISSGDSMAREAALLGVPSYYLGIRYDMPANAAASDVANLQNQKTIDVKDWIKRTIDNKDSVTKYQEETRKQINEKFIDLNQYMYNFTNQKI